ADEVGDRLAQADIERLRARLARLHGDDGAAYSHLGRALERVAEPSLERAAVLRELAQLREAQGRGDEARRAYREAVELYRARGSEGHARATAEALGAWDAQIFPEPAQR